jgi:serine/threonine protein kinase
MGIPPLDRVRFGVFELDLKAGELYKRGRVVLLQEQPFQVLLILVERRGELATRAEIRKKLWPNDTVVEFDHGINTAIKKLRQALGDSAQNPKYVETVGRRGYRLMTPVEWGEAAPTDVKDSSGGEGAPPELESRLEAMTGKRVSHYRVLEILGGGGMGVVYRAEDIKLGRRVALKFLPEELGKDARTIERFEREARSAAAVEHPNICPVYEFGEHEGQPFIVMQLLEGQTLRERMETGARANLPFRMDELLDIALQVAEGLEAAHQIRLVHRDIKPANIFLTNRGEVKILDFGLAKLTDVHIRAGLASEIEADGIDPPLRGAPEAWAPGLDLTRTGVALGTAAYMSPEQVRGEKLDGRTDLFSFGLVLYEMATGRPAFSGETTGIIHSAILNGTPTPVGQLNPDLPASLEEIFNKALEKDREIRYQTAAELRADLQNLAADLRSQTGGASVQPPPHGRSYAMVTGIFLLVLVSAAAFWFTKRGPSPPSGLPELTQRQLTDNSSENAVGTGAISPDGKYLAYSDGKGMHYKVVETGQTHDIPRTSGFNGIQVNWGIVPTWVDHGTKFLANAMIAGQPPSIWAIPVTGAVPRKLRDEAFAYTASRDGTRVAFATKPDTINYREMWLMRSDGKEAQKLWDADANSDFGGAEWSPDGQRLAYSRPRVVADKFENSIESRGLKGGSSATIIPAAVKIQDWCWSPDWRMIYSLREPNPNGNTCNFWAARVDARTGEPSKPPKRLTNWAGFCMDSPSATADAKRLTFRKWSWQGSVYVANLEPNGKRITTPSRLTLNEAQNYPMAWTADSRAVIFQSNRNGRWGIYKQSLSQDEAEPIVAGPEDAYEPRISPDGVSVLYVLLPRERGLSMPLQLMRVPITGGTPRLVLKWAFYGYHCAKSPAKLCAIAERSPDRKQLIFTGFDPLEGRGRELRRVDIVPDASYVWDLSPDGLRIAILRYQTARIQILSLGGGRSEEIVVRGWKNVQTVEWAADGKGLFVSASIPQGAALLQVDSRGNANVLWEQKGSTAPLTQPFEPLGGPSVPWGVPSPDGRHLAIYSWNLSANIWMIENF